MPYISRPSALARRFSLILLLLLLTGCAAAPSASALNTATPTTRAESSSEAQSRQSLPIAQVSASAAPTEAPPTPTPAPPPESASTIINVAEQAEALLPEAAAHLAEADEWDSYIITATLLPDALTIAGDMQVEVRNRGAVPYDALYFRLYPNHEDFGGSLDVEQVRVDGQPVAVSREQDGVLLRLALNQPLAPGERAVVAMRFAARSQQNASGYAYGAFNLEAGVWSLATFYPVLARRFGNEWDRRPVSSQGDLAVTETALYAVTIDTPPDWTLSTTGVRVEQQQLDHGPRRDRFVSGPQRDFFLAAVRGLSQASTVVDGTRIVTHYQPDNAALGQHSLTVAEQSLAIFNETFGRYPLAELEIIQVPLTRFLGVEYPGVILIEQSLYGSKGRLFDTTVAHEVAHQWWYSLVGNDVQGEPWLDEGLTSYAQVIYYEGLGNRRGAEGELQFFRNQYLAAREAGRDEPLGQPVGAFQGNYVAMVYAKGALFFHALRQRIGDEAFFRFLQSYYQTYRYDEATGTLMLQQAQTACGCDLQQFYQDWVNDAAPVAVP